ncbi:mediator of RNA polymerase II transcription subunit 12 [Nicotiana sylvestris]|uniref:Mediator of RNA polymerase II transcription subunit 12 n=1 Tax=Nicotiana sylvestris TaxID=4096 RepID=A0A1U7V6X6_NICSY|nr:PREDICTED: mediator of RNA polymerase II transcription subunit 12 [Nicotiana sylvestris]XP_009757490.1 PREDICTED: mediator of RNA polymerase II transcription subunit 12 [Nicotiana sylvestris]XP_009757491.1 PREDICTED: mediator of RNA polymerase II transcription subunit 12 [Nicotiana sylvestris]XP_009757492.1 PREDICTED: mediator of RNA polymerase II transcription subunit 12 [Nicotiana sylvestris]
MQRYHGGSCTSAVNNSTIGGSSARDSSRVESASLPPNFSRRPLQLTPYKLKCDKEHLNSRLGPPDFLPQTPNCPEETLTKEYVQSGYRETVEGLEEAREISLSQVQAFTKPVIFKCKEAIRKCHRAINESRAQKRKAGQIYGVPLEGLQLTKPGTFPDQRACGEEFRKKWIEGLSQQHKRLRSLADHVPHGYRRKSLFEVLIRNNVPLLRATWFVKVTYLNQVRPGSSSMSSGVPDKTHISRSEQWTKDVIDYLQYLLDEFISRNSVHSALHIRDRSPQMGYAGSIQLKSDPTLGTIDCEEPSLHFKWWYVVRILQWHQREGLLIPSLIIDWVLNQLQEKELLGVLQLLLPVIYGFIDTVVLSQSYVRTLVGIAIRFIQEPSPGGSDLVDNSRRAYTMAALAEMLRYLMLAVPDTFVALDCFPMPPCVMTNVVTDGSLYSKVTEDARKVKNGPFEVAYFLRDKGPEVRSDSYSISRVVSSIQKRAQNLAMAARPGHPGQNVAKALHALDKALAHGDLREAYKFLLENVHDSSIDDCWFAEVSSCLRSSLKYIRSVTLSSICSVFFICEWATCDFRDFRYAPPRGIKFTGRKDFSAIYIAVRLLKLKMREAGLSSRLREHKIVKNDYLRTDPGQLTNYSGRSPGSGASEPLCYKRCASGKCGDFLGMFDSPSPLHDILVCWIDQHEVQNTEGFKRLQLLIIELIRAGIFYPQAYVRQLIVSGLMDGNGPISDPTKQKRHCKILKHLPGQYVQDALEEARIAESHVLSEVMNVYCNERKLVLHGKIDPYSTTCGSSYHKHKPRPNSGESLSAPSIDQLRSSESGSFQLSKVVGRGAELEELKGSITTLLQLPSSSSTDTGVDETQVSFKKAVVSGSNGMDNSEGTPGCEECRRAKKQKISEEKSSYSQIYPLNPSDDEETWWMRKGQKSIESFRAEPPPKPAKSASKGRQKVVRKTQSLAQLAAARIEGSQGASTSHVCDSKISCPHHRSGIEGIAPKSADGTRMPNGDVVSIGKVLKGLRFMEKRTITVWLVGIVKQLVEESEKTVTKVGQYGRPFSAADERGFVRWKLGEDELSAVLYLIDSCDEFVLAAMFLLWLLPKVLGSCSATVHGSRNILTIPKNAENNVCEVGEAYLLSSMRRYESIIVAADLIPETLSVVMRRAQAILTSNGRVSGSPTVIYARYLLKKYGSVGSVTEWEKTVKSTFDKRLASEVESGRLLDGEFGYPLGVPVGVQDPDDYFRQKITGVRVSRVGLSMRDIVQKKVDEAVNYFYGKDRKLFGPNSGKIPGFQKWEDVYQIGQQIVMGLMDCMRQTGGAAQEGDPTLVSSAISAIVCNIGQVIAKIPDLTASNNHLSFSSTSASLHFARCILRIHVICLCILKEALGERQSRVFEVALATETSSALAPVFAPGKAPRSQFQLSPELNDSNPSSDILNNSSRVALGRAAKISAAVSALVIGAILQGVASLERMVSLFRLKDGLDVVHFMRSMRSNSNGNARSVGTLKADSLAEVSVHWFRVLVGNCRTVSDGFIVDLLGEASILALCRMQRMLPLNLVFPPAFSMFAFVLWRPLILNASSGTRDEVQQLHHSLLLAFGDVIKHLPFREVCLRDTHSLYDLIAADTVDSDFASLLEASGVDLRTKTSAFVPLRARLFLNALIDCRIPQPIVKQDDGNQVGVQGESKFHGAENETKLLDKLVYILDTLQPAKFHWQWIELRLLLNEQAVIEKLEGHDLSLVEALRSLSPNTDKASVSENESNIIEMILTRLLVRPDAAPLFSEVVHLLGRSLEDSMLLQAKWFLGGHDVLFGRKSVRQRLINIAVSKGLSTRAQYWKPWGWCPSNSDPTTSKGEKFKSEVSSIEEGEVVDEGTTLKRPVKGSGHTVDVEGFLVRQQHVTERALVDLILPCLDQASDDSRSTFASDMIKQMNHIEQQINAVTREASKPAGTIASGIESPTTKSSRKGTRGSSPGLARRASGPAETVPPSPVALRASLSLRLQFILRLFPIIYADREPSGRNMRYMLASVILRTLGSRIVHEDASHFFNQAYSSKRELDSLVEASSTASVVMSLESLFDRLLLLLHGLLSSHQPRWLKGKSSSKSSSESSKDYSAFEREGAENLQNELDRMQLPETVRWRIQSAMPILFPSVRWSISCQPPSVAPAALSSLLPSNPISVLHSSNGLNQTQRTPVSLLRTAMSVSGKAKHVSSQQENDLEVDPWILLEDGAGSSQSSSNSTLVGGSDNANLKASNWLKGTVRVRRTDLTYIGAVDDDS